MVNNLEYNTERPKLIIPEYGRHIQKMVDYAVAIENREERNKVAQAIIGVMGNLNPHLRDVPDFQHKLWDQLFIISDFKLNVDSPYPIPTKEMLSERPERLKYPQAHPKYRFYGNNIQKMINICNSWDEGELKETLKFTIANHMKKSFLNWNKDTVEDDVIFEHLLEMSGGRINLAKWDEDLSDSNNLMRARTKARPANNNNNSGKKQFNKNRNKKRY